MRNSILKYAIIAGAIIALTTTSCMKMDNMNMQNMNMIGQPVNVIEGNFSTPLSIPAIVSGTTILKAQNVSANINGFGSIIGLGYTAGGLLGPTIKTNNGSSVDINFINQLNENSNIHWHGLKIPANMDGHPANVVNAGATFNYKFTINQRAGLYWYHPHPDMLTAKQVFQGLAGLFIVNDNEESALNLPSGNKELPLVIQDKRISIGSIPYSPSMMEQMTGYMGQYVLVNGVYAPVQNVETSKYRLRILNGSNARIYNIALSNGAMFTLIGNDGGLLANPQSVGNLIVGPGERADLIVDFGSFPQDTSLFLINKTFNGGTAQGIQEFKIMKFNINKKVIDNFTIPSTLSTIPVLSEGMATKSRSFDISNVEGSTMTDMMKHNINGKSYDVSRIDETVTNAAIETWTFDNTNGKEPHPMHLHGVQFQIISRTGGRGGLTPLEGGWKDVVLCMPGEKVKIIVPFGTYVGKYVFHCHNLEHEDTGMMGQFQVN